MAIDLLMMFVKDGTPVEGESRTLINTKDDFMKGFTRGKFFEIDEFDMGISLVDHDTSLQPKDKDKDKDGEKEKKIGRFSKWVEGTVPTPAPGKRMFPLEMEPVSFSRQIDRFSPLLFQMCFQTKSFDSVSIVKRKISGRDGNTDGLGNIPFFRVDFQKVLVIGLEWEAGDVIKEKCKFVCRSVAVQYRPQASDGSASSIGATIGGQPLTLAESK